MGVAHFLRVRRCLFRHFRYFDCEMPEANFTCYRNLTRNDTATKKKEESRKKHYALFFVEDEYTTIHRRERLGDFWRSSCCCIIVCSTNTKEGTYPNT